MKRKLKWQQAINALADEVPNGHLLSSTGGYDLLVAATELIRELKLVRRERLRDEEWYVAMIKNHCKAPDWSSTNGDDWARCQRGLCRRYTDDGWPKYFKDGRELPEETEPCSRLP